MSDSFFAAKTIKTNFIVPLSHHSRSYKLIQLPNGILSLLISDPTKATVSSAVCVATGSHNDPPEVLGLAHFCEHMVFMGTKEFPEPDLLQRLVYTHGGDVNAHTTGEKTTFYFELPSITVKNDSSNFQDLLLVFASFFKHPLLSNTHCKDEVESVNAEHSSNIGSNGKRFYHGLRLLANKDHPFSRFGTGNSQTIMKIPKSNNINVFKELRNYFKKYYVPEKMTLVVRGPQSLNQLNKLVLVAFSDIPPSPAFSEEFSWSSQGFPHHSLKRIKRRSNLRHSSTSSASQSSASSEVTLLFQPEKRNPEHESRVFAHKDLNQCLLIKTDNDDSKLRLLFPTGAVETHPKFGVFIRAWISLLGDESYGSICQELIHKLKLATAVEVFSQELTQNDSIIIVELNLTKKGQGNLQILLITVFNYIYNVILDAPLYKLADFLTDMTKADKINYLFQDCSGSAIAETYCLAERLQSCPQKLGVDDLIRGFVAWDSMDSNLHNNVKDFIDSSKQVLSLANFNMIILTNAETSFSADDQSLFAKTSLSWSRDPYFHFEFKYLHVESLALLKEILRNKNCSMVLPAPNQFLSNFDNNQLDKRLHNTTDTIHCNPLSLAAQRDNMDEQPIPQLVDYTKYYELWHQQVHVNKASESEKVAASFKTQPLNLSPSANTNIGIEILCHIIGNSLRYKLYPAETIGYSWGIFPGVNSTPSIMFSLNGLTQSFSEVLKCAIDEIIQTLTNIHSLTYQVFKDARLEMRKHYEGSVDANTIHKVIAGSYIFLEENIPSLEERIEAIEEVDLEDLIFISDSFIQHLKYTSILINGTLDPGEVSKLSKIINLITKHEKVSLEGKQYVNFEPSSYLLPKFADLVFETSTTNRDNMIFYYIQLGIRESVFERTMCALVSYLISIHASNELRTKRQLGYTVLSGMRLFRKTLGVHVTISSDKFEPSYLKSQIEDCLLFMQSTIGKMTESEFQGSVIEPFLSTYEQIRSDQAIPCTSILSLDPVKGSNNPLNGELYRTHSYSWEKVVNRTYRFNSGEREEDIDKQIVITLTKKSLETYFEERIIPNSAYKSTFSFMIKSQFDKEQLRKSYMEGQVRIYLKSKGIRLESEEISDIVAKCEYDEAKIPSEILKMTRKRSFRGDFTLNISKSIISSALSLKSGRPKAKVSGNFSGKRSSTRPSEIILKGPRDLHDKCHIIENTKLEYIYNFLKEVDAKNQVDVDYVDMLEF